MSLRKLALAVSLGAAALLAHGADTPSTPAAAPSVDLTRSRALIAQQDWNGAIAELNREARKDRNNADVQNLLGYSLRNAGQTDKAFVAYNTALKLDPRHKGAHAYIGVAYLIEKQPAKAEEHLAALKAICGDNCAETQELAKAIADYKP